MKEVILEKLKEISEKEDIKILFANESGSRAWGFPSPDSDYDVRFIYVRPLKSYLSITAKPDHLSYPISNELDIYGWDLQKVLRLIHKSNTTPFEWLQSPTVYKQEEGFGNSLLSLCRNYFNRRKNTLHYLGIARGALETMISGDEIKVKKLFYVLRPLLAARWCLIQNSIAPMTIDELMTVLPDPLKTKVKQLIHEKASQPEGHIIRIDTDIRVFIENEFRACEEAAKITSQIRFDQTLLDKYFTETLGKYDH